MPDNATRADVPRDPPPDLHPDNPFGIVLGMEPSRPPSPGNAIDPQAGAIRKVFRVVGPMLLLGGMVCFIIAFVDFLYVMGRGRREPEYFWLFFLGAPIAFVGLVITNAAFMGRIARYQAHELAPVAADTANVLAEGIRPAVRDVASAIREGLSGQATPGARCGACGAENSADARFCDQCGKDLPPAAPPLPSFLRCARCNTTNERDANYCDHCGAALT